MYIVADDFAIQTLLNTEKIEPGKFDNEGALVDQNGKKLVGEKIDDKQYKFSGKPYKDDASRYESFNVGGMGHNTIGFQRHIADRKALTGLTSAGYLSNINAVASLLFVYGKANEPNNGNIEVNNFATTYLANVVNSPVPVNILDAVFCGRTNANRCRIFPTVTVDGANLSPTTNIFSELVAAPEPKNDGFITNTATPLLGMGTTPPIRDWVRNYISTSNRLEVQRNNPALQNGVETIQLAASNPRGTNGAVEVRVLTWPWLIYTPFIQNVRIETNPANNMGTPVQYFNYFWINYVSNQGQWGGEGEVKDAQREGDIGSFITGKDFEDIAEGENAGESSPTIRNDRIDW